MELVVYTCHQFGEKSMTVAENIQDVDAQLIVSHSSNIMDKYQ